MATGDGGLRSKNHGKDITYGIRKLNADLRAAKKDTTMAMLEALRRQHVEELSTPGQGRVRWNRVKVRRGRGVTAKAIARAGRASAPGQPPAPDTGALRGSMQIEYDDATQRGREGTNKKYAAALNNGTTRAGPKRNTTILPRPFMEPGLKKASTAMRAAGITAVNLKVRTRATRGKI